jgi:hypothetical protein
MGSSRAFQQCVVSLLSDKDNGSRLNKVKVRIDER